MNDNDAWVKVMAKWVNDWEETNKLDVAPST